MVFANKAMASRRHMEALAETWLEEAGTVDTSQHQHMTTYPMLRLVLLHTHGIVM